MTLKFVKIARLDLEILILNILAGYSFSFG
jgi:hypothetical protein